ncbi:predicted protein [Naegleria gruberi]|uniref:Predicted protein n=1 Tax=Naegleria gruberi TaxID=5762 RepID=D2V5E9_NAEGR|nr:uncharacterized protein NAEGRDRAFT_46667 [Naegleria gruberi]EFC48102.1 predicted protein [Naegleria gruberi]|eukprot:XP_002680846.1 predicted protein [Naegleria gruberi strain NEG-M]
MMMDNTEGEDDDEEDEDTPLYKKKAALQGLDSRELACLRWFELLNGKPQPHPDVDDYFIDKTKSKELIIHDLLEIQQQSPASPHVLLAGPFYVPSEEVNFKTMIEQPVLLKGNKSLYFNFKKKNKSESTSCFLHLHGGAYIVGNARTCHIYEKFCKRNGINLLGLEYSLYPHAQIEDIVEEAFRAFEWLVNEKKMDEIYIIGESSGGNLGLLLCEKIANLTGEQEMNYKSILKGAILFSPWLDLTLKGTSSIMDLDHQDRAISNKLIRTWKSNGVPCGLNQQERARNLSPFYWSQERVNQIVNQTISKGIFISYSERERFVDEIESFINKLNNSGVKLSKHVEKIPIHAFHLISDILPQHFKRCMTGVLNFIQN